MKRDFDVYASLLSATPEDADNVASWLADREAASKIEKMKVDETVQDAARLASEANAYDENIAISQIRILSKQYTSEPDVIPYVAVIDKWDDEMWLIIPFSPYKTPATPGEMVTGLDTFGLHVLQAWNGRTVQDELLKKSYLFGALPNGVRENALSLFQHEMGGVALPPDFESQRGSPIVEATDPRREYLAECIARLQPLSDAVLEMAGESKSRQVSQSTYGGVLDFLFDKYLPTGSGYALAAATEELQPKVPVLMCRDAWDAMMDSREVSGFSGYYAGDENRVLKFVLEGDVPSEMSGRDTLTVSAYTREPRQLVGKGMLRQHEDGSWSASVRLGSDITMVDVPDAGDLVLVVE